MAGSYLEEFYEQTYVPEAAPEEITPGTPQEGGAVLKLEKTGTSNETFSSHNVAEQEKTELGEEYTSKIFSEAMLAEVEPEIVLEPMLEAYEPDDCEDFYYISRGWGLYLTVMRAFPLSILLDAAAKEKTPIRCCTDFYHLSHTAEQNPKSECMLQITKTDEFVKVGTVLVFARKTVALEEESPEPDDSPQEYLLSDDMKTLWGVFWQNQERDRWNLINTGIVNKHTRVIFKTKTFSAFIVIQLTVGEEKSEKEDDDEDSSEEEGEQTPAGEEEEGEKEEKAEGGEEGELRSQESGEVTGKKRRKSKRRRRSFDSSMLVLDQEMCLQDELEMEEEGMEQGEGEAEEKAEEKPKVAPAAAAEAAETAPPTTDSTAEDSGEPAAPTPSPMVNKEETKDENASNANRSWGPEADRSANNNNISQSTAAANKNNNQLRNEDDDYDQSSLSTEERTVIVGLPSAPSSFAKLTTVPSIFRTRASLRAEAEATSAGLEVPEGEPEGSSGSEFKSTTEGTPRPPAQSAQEESMQGQELGLGRSKSYLDEEEEDESEEELPVIMEKKLSISVIKNGVKKLQDFKFGPKLTSLPLVGVDLEQVKTEIALMWRYRNHKQTSVLIFARSRGEGEFDMIVDVVQSLDTYVRAESHYSVGFKMVGESHPLPIKTGRFMSFTVEGPLMVEKCEGGVVTSQGNIRTRTMYFCHSQINSIEYIVKRPQVEEAKGPTSKKGKKKEEVKVDTEPDARLEVTGFNAGSSTNGVDLAVLPIWLTGPDLWHERHVHLRASDDKLLNLLIDCLTRSRALAKNWWRLLILLGYTEKEVEQEKGKTPPSEVVSMYIKKWFDDSLNSYDRGISKLIQVLDILNLHIAIDNVVRIIKVYKAHLLKESVRPRYLKLLFHWVLQTKITRNNLLRLPDPPILRPVSDVFLLHLSNFLPKEELFKVGAAMEVEDNVLHAIAGEEIISDDAYLGFRVLIKSRQKKDEIIHYTLLLLEMFKQVELPEATEFLVRETKKWMETLAESDHEICNKLDNLFT